MFGITRLAQRLDEYISRTSFTALIFQIASSLVSFFGLIFAILKLPHLSIIFFVLLLVLSLFLLVLNTRLFEEKKKIRSFLKFLIHAQPQQYKYEEIEEVNTITPTGDGKCAHRYTIAALGTPVYWARFQITVTDDVPGAAFSSLGFAVRSSDGNPLGHLAINEAPRSKDVIVFFHTPATPGNPYTITFEYTWPGCWKTLLSKCGDTGDQEFTTEVGTYKYVLEFPNTHRVYGFYIIPPVLNSTVSIKPDGTKVEWTVTDIPRQKYRFEIACTLTS